VHYGYKGVFIYTLFRSYVGIMFLEIARRRWKQANMKTPLGEHLCMLL